MNATPLRVAHRACHCWSGAVDRPEPRRRPAFRRIAWHYFAAFVAVILSLITEPLPAPAIGLIGVTAIAVLRTALQSRASSPIPHFASPAEALKWALAGFANGTVWLIFAAFVVAMGYEKTRLGRRIALVPRQAPGRRTLGLGYAIALSDLALAPFTPSNTARSAGTIFPIIRNIPELYGSRPGRLAAADWRVSDVGGVRHDLRHELDVRHRARAEPPRARDGQDRTPASRSRGPTGSSGFLPVGGAPAPAAALRRLQALSARDPRRAPKCRDGRRWSCARWDDVTRREAIMALADPGRPGRSGSSVRP